MPLAISSNAKKNLLFILSLIIYIVLATLLYKRSVDGSEGANDLGLGGITAIMGMFLVMLISGTYLYHEGSEPVTKTYLAKMVGWFVMIIVVIGGCIWGGIAILGESGASKEADGVTSASILTIVSWLFVIGIAVAGCLFAKDKLRPYMGRFSPSIPQFMIQAKNRFLFEFTSAPRMAWIVIALSASAIGCQFLVPWMVELISNRGTLRMIGDSISLRTPTTIASYDMISQVEGTGDPTYNYAISMWVFIDAQPPGTSPVYSGSANIINYGGKPQIVYCAETQSFKFQMEGLDTEPAVVENVPYQKWNQLVMNYDGGTMDIFMNGKLVISKLGYIPKMSRESIMIGELNGIHGGIKNCIYHPTVLSQRDISLRFATGD